jgi:hypothetical protein
LPVIKGVVSIWKIETGLERGNRLQRKLRNTVLLLERKKKWAASEIVVADSRGGSLLAQNIHPRESKPAILNSH